MLKNHIDKLAIGLAISASILIPIFLGLAQTI